MTFRCTATTTLEDGVRELAAEIGSPHADVEWSSHDMFQCLVEDVPHDFHAAFLRSGSRVDPGSDVFLCWTDGPAMQGVADLDCCLKVPDPMGSVCTIFKEHPGRCDWEYIDPELVAARAQADQMAKELGLSKVFRDALGGPS